MNRLFPWIKVLLAVGFLVSAAAAAREIISACDACTLRAPIPVGLLAAFLYGTLLVGSLVFGPAPLVFIGIMMAGAVHGVLVGHMFSTGASCLLCILAAVNAGALVFLSLLFDLRNVLRLAFIAPATAAGAALILMALPKAPMEGDAAQVARSTMVQVPGSERADVVVFEKDDCPYCVELRGRVLPRLEDEFGARIRVTYRNASEMPGLNRTPTLMIIPRSGNSSKMIEGLPPYEMLRNAVARALASTTGASATGASESP